MDTSGDIVEAMLDPRFPAECAVLFAAVATANRPTTLTDLCTRAHVVDRTGARQIAKLRALGIITSTRGNHCLTITINPRDQWAVNGAVSVVGSPRERDVGTQRGTHVPSSVLTPSPDIFPDLPEISFAQPAASAAVPPCVGTVLPTADASISAALAILQSCALWKDGFTLADLLAIRLEFPTANLEALALKFVRKYGKSERAWHPNWKKAKVPDWPNRFVRHIEYHTENKIGGPSATRPEKRRWSAATEEQRTAARQDALALLQLRQQSEQAIRDKLDDYAAAIYEGRPI